MTQRGRAGGAPSSRRPAAGRREGARPTPTPALRTDLSAHRARLREVVEPVVVAQGYDLEDLTLSRAGRRHVVRVIVDGDGGINLDAVAVVSRAISTALDAAEETAGELLAGEYQLEVSSPGTDCPLRLPRHWRRNVSRLVEVTVADKAVTGRIVRADDDGVVLDVGGTERTIGYADLGPGRIQIEFNRIDEVELDDELDGADDGDDSDDEDVEDEER